MTIFEKVSSILNDTDKDNLQEYCIYWCKGDEYATVNFPTLSRHASKIRKLAEKRPDDVRIFSETGGVMVAGVPVKAVKLSIVERELTEEQLEELRERMREMQKSSRQQIDVEENDPNSQF